MTSNPARSTGRPAFTARAEFAATEFMHDEREDDYTGFAPTSMMELDPWPPVRPFDAPPRAVAVSHPVPFLTAADALAPGSAQTPWDANSFAQAEALAALSQQGTRRGWLWRIEQALDRVLPAHLGTLLQLFVCVSLSMALLSAMVPMLDTL